MQDDYFALMQTVAPDLAEQIERRALVLERIDALQPVGRRMLAGRLNLPEREVRTISATLKDNGLVRLTAAGMTLTPKAEGILTAARRFSRELRGLTKMETALSKLLHVPRVYVAAGDADQDPHVLREVGRLVAARLRSFLRSGSTLAVTGGQTMLEVAYALFSGHGDECDGRSRAGRLRARAGNPGKYRGIGHCRAVGRASPPDAFARRRGRRHHDGA